MVLWSNMLGIHKTLFQEMVNLSSSSAQGSDADGLSSGYSMMLARVVDADRCVRQVIATIVRFMECPCRCSGADLLDL